MSIGDNPSGMPDWKNLGSATGASSSDPYDPSAIQDLIRQILAQYETIVNGKEVTRVMPESVIMYLMYLMSEYHSQMIGQIGWIAGKVSQDVDYINEMIAALASVSGGSSGDPTVAFNNALIQLEDDLKSNSYFTTGGGKALLPQIESAIASISSVSCGSSSFNQLWQAYEQGVTSANSGSNPAVQEIGQLINGLNTLQSAFGGSGKNLQALEQAETQNLNTSYNLWNNMMKKMVSIITTILNNQKTQ